MEKTKNNRLMDFFKNIGEAFGKLINSGEVDEVELTGDLAKDPVEVFNSTQSKVSSPVERVSPSRTRAPKTQSRTSRPSVEKDEERDI